MAITISQEMRTLLKSKVMVGSNAPTAKVLIEDMPSGDGLVEVISSGNYFVIHPCGSAAIPKFVSNYITDSKGDEYCIAYDAAAGKLKKGTMDTNEDYLTTDYPITGLSSIGIDITTPITSMLYMKAMLHKLPNGEVLMFVYSPMIQGVADLDVSCYKSATGDGNDFVFLSTVTTVAREANVSGTYTGLRSILVTSSGAIIVNMSAHNYHSAGYNFHGIRICRSDDNGATWALSYAQKITNYEAHGQLVQLEDGTVCTFWVTGGAAVSTVYSNNDGATFTSQSVAGWTWNVNLPMGLLVVGSFLYSVPFGGVYPNVGMMYYEDCPDYASAKVLANWAPTSSEGFGASDSMRAPLLYVNSFNRLIIQFLSRIDNVQKIVGCLPLPEATLPIKDVYIDITKGMASQATVVLPNTDGQFSPDRGTEENPWKEIVWPNRTVEVSLGYGASLQKVFTGMIDSVTMKAGPPQTIEFVCRDMLKRALDQTVMMLVGEVPVYTVLYQWQTPEYIFRDLAIKAGWITEDVVTDVSGVTIEQITFTHESYADAFQRLCELCGFEFYCDEGGKLYFNHATDRSPAVAPSSVVLNGTAYTEVPDVPEGHPMSSGSVTVTSSNGLIVYVEDTDYIVRLGSSTSNAAIARKAGGSIGDGATVLVSCVYAHWIFSEGEDIFSLDYTISDQDIYAKIIVIGQDSDGAFIRGDEDFDETIYYGVLPGKILITSAGDLASTSEQCAVFAQRTGAASLTKAREAYFSAVGNPYVQVGDCIQVIEASSTISEIYRIFSLTHTLDASGKFKSSMGCYHHGYASL